ncbi:DUF2066 domain-containing protein [Marinobacterium litorale]|uniref:DUF2066 domain-containing protein n=1 Tax=Marinobacterium litorale TaxID=404770 RepID=UPI0004122A91|nr:DUF2066 domain-containing protein [Marinobacterium litorale]
MFSVRPIQRSLRHILLGICCLLPLSASAESLYSARVGAGLAPEQQLQAALNEVVIKLSGTRSVLERPELSTLRDNAPLLVESREPQAEGEVIRFEEKALTSLMANLGLPVIAGQDRPELLVWLLHRTANGVEFIEPGTLFYPAMREVAASRGLPLRVPLLDLTDQLAITPEQAAEGASPALLRASARYQPDAVLVGVMEGGRVLWSYSSGDLRYQRQSDASQAGIGPVLNAMADQLLAGEPLPQETVEYQFQRVVVDQYVPAGLELELTGITSADDYLAATAALRSLPQVDAVITSRQTSQQLMLTLVGLSPASEGLVRQDARFQIVAPGRYRWVGSPESAVQSQGGQPQP